MLGVQFGNDWQATATDSPGQLPLLQVKISAPQAPPFMVDATASETGMPTWRDDVRAVLASKPPNRMTIAPAALISLFIVCISLFLFMICFFKVHPTTPCGGKCQLRSDLF